MKQTFVVEVPVYLRLMVEVDDRLDPDTPPMEAAEQAASAYVAEFAPEMKSTMTFPIGPATTLLEHRIVTLCPGEDDHPDIFDATGTVQLN